HAVGGAVIGDDRDRARRARRIVAGVDVSDRGQRGLVVRDTGRAGQSKRAGGGIERAGDAVLVGEAEDVLAVDVISGDLHRYRSEIGVVGIGHGKRRVERGGGLVLGVVQGVAGGDHRRLVEGGGGGGVGV